MKNIFKIYTNDLKTIIKNPATIIIMIGLSILPSLYAWINIAASWNPYANTGNLPVAVVNNDEGDSLNGKNINVGAEIIKQLEDNKNISWQFVDEWQANYGLNEGKYYALIEIPSDFSKDLTSLASVAPTKPHIVYRVNEKLNAIATKITNAAKNQLADSVKSNFIATVNSEAIKSINNLGDELKLDKSNIIQLKDTLNEATGNIASIQKLIDDSNANSSSLQQYLNSFKSTLPKITEQINTLQKTTEANKELILSTKQTINNTSNTINNDLIQIQSTNMQTQNVIESLKNSSNNDLMKQLTALNSSLNSLLESDINYLNIINSSNPNDKIKNYINSLNGLKNQTSTETAKIDELNKAYANNSSTNDINAMLDSLSSLSKEISNAAFNVSNMFYSSVMPALNTISNSLTSSMDNTNLILENTKIIVPQLESLANFGIGSSQLSIDQANDLNSKLSTIQSQLQDLSNKMNTLSNDNLDQIINLVNMNPNDIAGFLSSPIDVKETDLYGEGIFGIGLTPFYSVLAVWVGSLLACALLTVENKKLKNIKNLTLKQEHFGKLLLFLTLSLIQSTIIILGDRYILGVKPENFILMFFFGILTGITFTIIIFTLVSLFGNIGKAIAVVIMVFQIAGSGGIYPIQTNPDIFGVLQPLWPFTYAINGFREAISGPIWTNVYLNILALLAFCLVFLVLVIFKKPFHKITEYMEHKFKEAGL